jgi:hypothetical protein
MHELTSYQNEIARAILDSVLNDRGLTFTVEIAKGGGARELSAQIEKLLLTLHLNDGAQMFRIAPPGASDTRERLISAFRQSALQGLWSAERAFVRLGKATLRFVSIESLGPTLIPSGMASAGLIEVADAQRVPADVYNRWLQPLAEATGATTVLYGYPLDGKSRFEQTKQQNREAQQRDGLRRHFRVCAEQVARALPGYRRRMELACERLGEEHPEFRTGYLLRPMPASGPLLSAGSVHVIERGMRGRGPAEGERALASVVVMRLPDASASAIPLLLNSHGASAVVTVAQQDSTGALSVVEHRWLQAIDAATLVRRIARVVDDWRPERLVAEERTTQGVDFRMLLEHALGRLPVEWAHANEYHDSQLALGLLAAVHTGKLTLYSVDGSPEHRALRHELVSAVAEYTEHGLLSLRMPSGDEGFLRGLMLVGRNRAPASWPARTSETALAS